jgi:hypothetical protein
MGLCCATQQSEDLSSTITIKKEVNGVIITTTVEVDLPPPNLVGKDKLELFELSLPFSRIKISTFRKKVLEAERATFEASGNEG